MKARLGIFIMVFFLLAQPTYAEESNDNDGVIALLTHYALPVGVIFLFNYMVNHLVPREREVLRDGLKMFFGIVIAKPLLTNWEALVKNSYPGNKKEEAGEERELLRFVDQAIWQAKQEIADKNDIDAGASIIAEMMIRMRKLYNNLNVKNNSHVKNTIKVRFTNYITEPCSFSDIILQRIKSMDILVSKNDLVYYEGLLKAWQIQTLEYC